MAALRFLLVSEGSSDEGLVPHLQALCLSAGASEVSGVAPDYGLLPDFVSRDVRSRLAAGLRLEPNVDLVFVHRDADARDAEPRYVEIRAAAEAVGVPIWVAVVPIQQTEAWLLLDADAIRRVAENPRGTTDIGLPANPRAAERIAQPKERLREALLRASESSGRRRRNFKRDFPAHRARLLAELPIQGSIEEMTAWARLRDDIGGAIEAGP